MSNIKGQKLTIINPAINIPQHRVNINHYDQARIILIINAIMVTLTKQK